MGVTEVKYNSLLDLWLKRIDELKYQKKMQFTKQAKENIAIEIRTIQRCRRELLKSNACGDSTLQTATGSKIGR